MPEDDPTRAGGRARPAPAPAIVVPAVAAVAAPGAKAAPKAVEPARRDARLDVFRGLALVMIFINHVPGNPYENWTSRNFGFSDAAEGFVFMSGLAAGLAYSGNFRKRPRWPAAARVWGRAWTLYLVHLCVTWIALGIAAAAALGFGVLGPVGTNNIPAVIGDPLAAMIGVPLLSHQLGYMNILPLYIVMLLATPFLLVAARAKPWTLIAGSVALWFAAGWYHVNLPSWPVAGEWFFNPFSWQLLFVIGLASGVAMKRGRRLVPADPRALRLAAGVVLFVALWALWDDLGVFLDGYMHRAREAGVPLFLAGYDKPYVSVPRLLHFLALAYLLGTALWVRRACESRWARPFALMGRHGLTIFAFGTVLAFVAQAVKAGTEAGLLLDSLLIFGGLALQFGLAWTREAVARARRRALREAPQPAPGAPVTPVAAPRVAAA